MSDKHRNLPRRLGCAIGGLFLVIFDNPSLVSGTIIAPSTHYTYLHTFGDLSFGGPLGFQEENYVEFSFFFLLPPR